MNNNPESSHGEVIVYLVLGWIFGISCLMIYFGVSELTTGLVVGVSCIIAFVTWVRRENAKIDKENAEFRAKQEKLKRPPEGNSAKAAGVKEEAKKSR